MLANTQGIGLGDKAHGAKLDDVAVLYLVFNGYRWHIQMDVLGRNLGKCGKPLAIMPDDVIPVNLEKIYK